MTKYLTIHTANKNKDDLLNDLALFGWTLQEEKRLVRVPRNIKIIGPFNPKRDRPVAELTLEFKNDGSNSEDLYSLSLDYLKTIERYLSVRDSSIARFITGLVFGTLFVVSALVMLGMPEVDNTGAYVLLGIFGPALPLCVFGIVFRSINRNKCLEKVNKELEELKEKAHQIK